MAREEPARADRQRLDKWLFFARFAKSRALGAAWAEAGRIRINGRKTDKPDAAIRVGDVLTMALPSGVHVVQVKRTGERRGPPAEARLMHAPVAPTAQAPAGDDPPHVTGTR